MIWNRGAIPDIMTQEPRGSEEEKFLAFIRLLLKSYIVKVNHNKANNEKSEPRRTYDLRL